MKKWNKFGPKRIFCFATGLILFSVCQGGFNSAGYELRVIQSEPNAANAAVSFQSHSLWIGETPDKPYHYSTSFILPEADEILFSRLYLNIWGGSNAYTCRIDTTVNGTAVDVVQIGGTDDTNPVYDPNQTCVYGSGYGSWQVAYAGMAERLNTDGAANEVGVTISDPDNSFDGRTIDAALLVVYRDESFNHVLDYYVIEANGYMRRTPGTPGSPAERIVDVNSINTSDVIEALYTAHYTHGTADQNDQLYFNGTQLGGDDVAVGAGGTYGPDVPAFDVTDLLSDESTILYSVDEAVVGTPSEYSLNARIGLLEIIHTPYHCTETILGDVNNDCQVNLADLALMASNWLVCNREPQSACWE